MQSVQVNINGFTAESNAKTVGYLNHSVLIVTLPIPLLLLLHSGNIMRGLIVLWSGAIVDIPTGWVLCDGNNGTPDLRDKFIVGAGNTYAVGAAGGNVNHNHTFTGDGHMHTLAMGMMVAAAMDHSNTTNTIPATGTTDNENGLPPYYSLAYIMKT
ncbi:hypothetical protein ES703_86360 [subsurface metagenome]